MKCLICKNDIEEKFILTLTKCKHTCCHQCLCNYINDKFDVLIKCPIEKCEKTISDSNLRMCLSNDQIIQYENLSLEIPSSQIQKCLSKNCPFYYYPEGKNLIFSCNFCGQPNCLQCNRRHYPNQTCQSRPDEKYLDKMAKENIAKRKREEFKSLDKEHDLIPNPDSFECKICDSFILPRTGCILRNCLHTFCNSCLLITFGRSKFLNQTSCPNCKVLLEQRESLKLIGIKKLLYFSIKEKRYKYYNCKSPDCENFWSIDKESGFHKCSKCKSNNCLKCKAIHPNETCEKYLQTHPSENFSSLVTEDYVVCFHCGKLLVKAGGCGSLGCNNCNNQTCIFTGEEVGRITGCKCNPDNPCHQDCINGCFPDEDDHDHR